MELIKKITIAILLVSFVTFVALFGRLPAFRKTPIGLINRLIWVTLPSSLLSLDIYLTRGRCTYNLNRFGHYLMNENHPLILIFFQSLLFSAECFFLPSAWSRLSWTCRVITLLSITAPYIFTYKCVKSKSSTITPNNHQEQMQYYPYDHVLFQPGQTCRTCSLLKPARSKHCSICNVCVAKHDHHCIWVMNCLGRENYIFFIGLLLSLSILLSYGAYLAYVLLDSSLQDTLLRHPDSLQGKSHWSVGNSWSKYFDKWTLAIAEDFPVGGVGMLALLTAPLAWGLLSYHIYLIWAGMTTNESFKWAEWRDDITDGLVYKEIEPIRRQSHMNDDGVEPVVKWPFCSQQRLVNRAQEHTFERYQASLSEPLRFEQPRWSRIDSLSQIENIYDIGFLNNFKDALRIR